MYSNCTIEFIYLCIHAWTKDYTSIILAEKSLRFRPKSLNDSPPFWAESLNLATLGMAKIQCEKEDDEYEITWIKIDHMNSISNSLPAVIKRQLHECCNLRQYLSIQRTQLWRLWLSWTRSEKWKCSGGSNSSAFFVVFVDSNLHHIVVTLSWL